MPDLTPHREPHQRTAALARGVAQMLDTEWTLALAAAKAAPKRPRLDTLGADRGGPRSVGTHSDPTGSTALGAMSAAESHPLANRTAELNTAHRAAWDALTHLAQLIEHTLDFDRRTLERLDREEAAAELRAAQPAHRYCWACDSPCDRTDGCDACRQLYRRTPTTTYLAHAADLSEAARSAAFARWVQRRVAEGTLSRPASPHAQVSRVIVHEHEVDPRPEVA